MKREIQGICLSMGIMGLAYVILLVILMLFTGVKIFNTILIIASLSSVFIVLGLSPSLKKRIKIKIQMAFSSK